MVIGPYIEMHQHTIESIFPGTNTKLQLHYKKQRHIIFLFVQPQVMEPGCSMVKEWSNII